MQNYSAKFKNNHRLGGYLPSLAQVNADFVWLWIDTNFLDADFAEFFRQDNRIKWDLLDAD